MDALALRIGLVLTVFTSTGAVYETPNFTVHAANEKFAVAVGKHAEMFRRELAIDWLGKPLPRWSRRCPIHVRVGPIGAGGETKFVFDRGEVFGWVMKIQGSEERILDSVLPHEINHTIFACHFRRPLPRWADEGAATLVEHSSERMRQINLLDEVVENGSRFPLRQLLSMKNYPQDNRRVLTLYAQGYSLAEFLIQQGGRKRYLQFLDDAHRTDWDRAILKNYEHKNVETLEKRWAGWVLAGSPRLDLPADSQLAAADQDTSSVTIRAQNSEQSTSTARVSQPRSDSSRSDTTDLPAGRSERSKSADPFDAPDPRGASGGSNRGAFAGVTRGRTLPLVPVSRQTARLRQPVLHKARPVDVNRQWTEFPKSSDRGFDFGIAGSSNAP